MEQISCTRGHGQHCDHRGDQCVQTCCNSLTSYFVSQQQMCFKCPSASHEQHLMEMLDFILMVYIFLKQIFLQVKIRKTSSNGSHSLESKCL